MADYGESIGQVASQTLQSLAATDEVCELPVYRPVIGFDKEEIVQIPERSIHLRLPSSHLKTAVLFCGKHPVTNQI